MRKRQYGEQQYISNQETQCGSFAKEQLLDDGQVGRKM
jgi:hypothetical protein